MTEYLATLFQVTGVYRAILPELRWLLEQSEDKAIVDLCSGSGGPLPALVKELESETSWRVKTTLTDLYPQQNDLGSVSYCPQPVDATAIPQGLQGMRTIFTGFHHFHRESALGILAQAATDRVPIGIFEVTGRRPQHFAAVFLTPITAALLTPFIRPFSWWRLLFTYLIPVIPIFATWDGIASNFRSYSVSELKKMVDDVNRADYAWISGTRKVFGLPIITYLIGAPR